MIDDDTDICSLLALILENAGYHVLKADNGLDGLAIAKKERPNLIISDIEMPNMDGYQLCAKLQENSDLCDTPVIFLSAHQKTKDKIKGLNTGAIDYITKPFEAEEVIARVQLHLRVRSLTYKLMSKQRRIEEDLRAAGSLQRALLPKELPNHPLLEFAWKFQPSEEIGGDLLNAFNLTEESVACYIVDVSGHGVPAALVTFSIAQLLQNMRLKEQSACQHPQAVLTALCKEFPFERFGKFLTMVYLICDTKNGILRYCNAGHPYPILVREGGGGDCL